uniref:Tetratricopeptide TPR_2 repeat protein n=1 Tax=Cyanothece sp. (strain PCC 7425 / ATCC 29141) TaxID=395961 RepID=B8HJY5_CYAP4
MLISHYDYGISLLSQGSFQEAIEVFSKAINTIEKGYKNTGSLFEYRGDANGYLGNYLQAVKDYEKAIELNPDLLKARLKLGVIKLFQFRRFSEAWETFNLVVQQNPRSANGYFYRAAAAIHFVASCYNPKEISWGTERLNSARLDLNLAESYYQSDAEFTVAEISQYRGRVFMLYGDYKLADVYFTTAVALDPTDGTSFYLRGINRYLLWFNNHLVGPKKKGLAPSIADTKTAVKLYESKNNLLGKAIAEKLHHFLIEERESKSMFPDRRAVELYRLV